MVTNLRGPWLRLPNIFAILHTEWVVARHKRSSPVHKKKKKYEIEAPHHWKVEKAPAAVEKLHRYIVEAVVVIAVSKEDLDNENADPKLHSVATLLKSALSYSAAAAHAGGCLKLLLLQLLYGILICLFWKSNIFVPK